MRLFRRHHDADTDIDLRDDGGADPFGLPTPCPQCGNVGYVDKLDRTNEVMRQHCPSCFHRWSVTRDEVSTGR